MRDDGARRGVAADDADAGATRGPGAAGRAALRLIDGLIGWLGRLRSRFDSEGEETRGKEARGKEREPDGRHGQAAGESAEAPPRRSLLWPGLLIGVICLAAGAGIGGLLLWRELRHELGEHAAVVEGLQDELDVSRKEAARSVNLMARFQRENNEFRQQLQAAQSEAQSDKARIDELEKQLAAARRPERPVGQVGRSTPSAPVARHPAPPKGGNCAINGGKAGADLAECIEKFNQR